MIFNLVILNPILKDIKITGKGCVSVKLFVKYTKRKKKYAKTRLLLNKEVIICISKVK